MCSSRPRGEGGDPPGPTARRRLQPNSPFADRDREPVERNRVTGRLSSRGRHHDISLSIQRDDPGRETASPGLATVAVVTRTVAPTLLTGAGDEWRAPVVGDRGSVSGQTVACTHSEATRHHASEPVISQGASVNHPGPPVSRLEASITSPGVAVSPLPFPFSDPFVSVRPDWHRGSRRRAPRRPKTPQDMIPGGSRRFEVARDGRVQPVPSVPALQHVAEAQLA